MSQSNLLELARAERSSYLETLKSLVNLESPTDDKAANDRLATFLEDLLEQDGWAVQRLSQTEVGDQLIARLEAGEGPSTLLLCHFDTVWPLGTLDVMPLKEVDGKLYGPGVLDMKAGIASAIHAVRLAKKAALAFRGTITLLLTSDEEKGSHYSRELIESQAQAHDRVLVLEPGTDTGAVKIGRKGTGDFKLHFKGISAHAGNNPKDGASALRELAHFVLFAEELTDYDVETTVNVTVASAGTVTNVIAEEASARVDMRIMKLSEAERVETAIKGYTPRDPRLQVTVMGEVNRPPLEFTEQNKTLFKELESAMQMLGLALESAIVGGGSDGNFTSALGIPTMDGLGSSGTGPHARHEHIRIDETLDRLALLTALLTTS